MFGVNELHRYSTMVRGNFSGKLSELPWEMVEKNREASFYSMKNILLHMIDNEDWMVNWVIPGRANEYSRRKWSEYTNMEMIVEHMSEVESRTVEYLASASKDELQRITKLTTSKGDVFDLTVEECLFQSFTEQLYHMGELIALLWQENIEPPKMQWFWNNPRKT
jgi:uncharacterized damage-inducible protein DinB